MDRDRHPDQGLTGQLPAVWVIDAEHWPRAYLVAELQERGYEANGFLTVIDAIVALRHREPRPKAIVLELRGQKLARVELESLRRTGIPIIALGGQVEFNDLLAQEFKWAAQLHRPMSIGAVADTVDRTLAFS